jgi:hypothetical protein
MQVGKIHFAITYPCLYGLSFIIANALIRVSMCALRTWQLYCGWPPDFGRVLLRDICGQADIPKARDFLLPMFIGIIEVALYPVLIATTAWTPIGGWLAIKTAANWRWQATQDTQSYMRFLLGMRW